MLEKPVFLADGLVLRRGTVADTEGIALFNSTIHSDDPGDLDEGVGVWTRDLMGGNHPTVQADDFTLVEDPSTLDEGGQPKIVSTLMLISQTWSYAGIPFGFGQPELVGTDPDYRRRGLVRRQMEAIHQLSAAKGHWVQGITGIPWYYRQFGYEMTLNLGGGRIFVFQRSHNQFKEEEPGPAWTQRPAILADIPALTELYARHCAHSLLRVERNEAAWRQLLVGHHPKSVKYKDVRTVMDEREEIVGYFACSRWGTIVPVLEIAVRPGDSLRALSLFAARMLRYYPESEPKADATPPDLVDFHLGAHHPVYTALGRQLEAQDTPYGWYMRVADVAGFLRHISPVLEERLAQSVVAGYTGRLRLNFFTHNAQLTFEQGKLAGIDPYNPVRLQDGDAQFPDHTFLHLLFGHRNVAEIKHIRPDCYVRHPSTEVLLEALFPKQPSTLSDWT